jgi:hypothetical protein
MSLNLPETKLAERSGGEKTAVEAELRPDRQARGLAGDLGKGLKIGWNFGRKKLVNPLLIAAGLKLSLFDDATYEEMSDPINQMCNDAQLRDNRRPAKRTNRRFAQNGKIFFERAIRSFNRRAQSKQLAIALSASGDFQNKPRMLSNRDMHAVA